MMKQFGNGFECLEDRTLLAGNITATLVGGTLFVTGNDTANYILLEGGGSEGEIDVYVGQGETLSVNGGTVLSGSSGSFDGVTNIVVNGGNGNDYISVGGAQIDDTVNIVGSLLMNGGNGNDYLSVYGGNGGVTLSQSEANARDVSYDIGGSVAMNGGAGNDVIEIERMSVGGNVLILGGAGNDDVDVGYNDIGGNATILGQAGNDRICFAQNDISGYALISGGLGNDSAYLGTNWIDGPLLLFIDNNLTSCPFYEC